VFYTPRHLPSRDEDFLELKISFIPFSVLIWSQMVRSTPFRPLFSPRYVAVCCWV